MTHEELRALALEATPGPWQWWGNVDYPGRIDLATVGRGICVVMGFKRAGMQGAEPYFFEWDPSDNRDGWLNNGRRRTAREVAVKEQVYRGDIDYLDTPNAKWIAAASPDVVLALLDEIDSLKAIAERNTSEPCP